MNKIQVKLMVAENPYTITQLACSMTRGANRFDSVDAIINELNEKPWSVEKVLQNLSLPHSKLSRFIDVFFLITGTSRRFLAQLTTHHIGISIISGSLQYSDHSKHHLEDMFTVPYSILNNTEACEKFKSNCAKDMRDYNKISKEFGNDCAGYKAPEALRNVLLVKVNLEELRFMCNQRLCARNTDETSYVIGLMAEAVVAEFGFPDKWFMPSCVNGGCKEGKYNCGNKFGLTPATTIAQYLDARFPLLRSKNEGESSRERDKETTS